MSQFDTTSLWFVCVAANGVLLFRVAPRLGPTSMAKLAGSIALAAPVVFVAIALLIRATGAHPSYAFGNRFVAAFIATVVMAMINIMNVTFHGMVDGVIAFHERHNAANVHRFPIRTLISYRTHLKMAGTTIRSLGSTLMLYGIRFDTKL